MELQLCNFIKELHISKSACLTNNFVGTLRCELIEISPSIYEDFRKCFHSSFSEFLL